MSNAMQMRDGDVKEPEFPPPPAMRRDSDDSQTFIGFEHNPATYEIHLGDSGVIGGKENNGGGGHQLPDLPSFFIADKPASYYARYPNFWCKIRDIIREPAAEALGTFALVFIGLSVNCQVALSANAAIATAPMGIFLSNAFGWAFGAACGVWISAGISGGHINPVVTIAMAVFRGFSWKKVPGFIFAQVIGSFIAALSIYGNYFHAIDIAEGGVGVRTVPGTASIFTSYAANYVTDLNAFFTEFLCSFILLLVVFAVTDKHNSAPPPYIIPLAVFAAHFCIISGLGLNTSFAINPARDFGPRLMTAIVGYGEPVWAYRHQFWLWCTICGPITGGLVAALIYDVLLYVGSDGIFNRPSEAARRWTRAQEFARERMQRPGGAMARAGAGVIV